MVVIYFDGGCSPNPGKMSVAVISPGGIKHHEQLGYGTNNEAEWLGFLLAVEYAKPYASGPVEIVGDSKLVIMQALGLWKVNVPALKDFRDDFNLSKGLFANLKLTHVKRHLNLAGIYIEELQKKR